VFIKLSVSESLKIIYFTLTFKHNVQIPLLARNWVLFYLALFSPYLTDCCIVSPAWLTECWKTNNFSRLTYIILMHNCNTIKLNTTKF